MLLQAWGCASAPRAPPSICSCSTALPATELATVTPTGAFCWVRGSSAAVVSNSCCSSLSASYPAAASCAVLLPC
jgi:hypothetical protein